jgi:hypothetical protein
MAVTVLAVPRCLAGEGRRAPGQTDRFANRDSGEGAGGNRRSGRPVIKLVVRGELRRPQSPQ